MNETHLPLLHALHALRVELLDGDHHADAGARRVHGLLVDPALVHPPEPALAQNRVRPEVARRGPELREGEDAEVGRLQDPPLLPLLLVVRVGGGGGREGPRAAAGAGAAASARRGGAAVHGRARRPAAAGAP